MNFENKIVSFSVGENSYNHEIISPQFEEINRRVFLAGKIPIGSSESGWSDEKNGGVAWGSITDFLIFDLLEEYLKATEKSRTLEDNGGN